ncbi:MAG: helix-hairpin-helix domain-containing protein [Bacteroidaceae bacterium]|nr:helix-hairpin-helix domain-containing protein [Bacteroidaceae bacterium]
MAWFGLTSSERRGVVALGVALLLVLGVGVHVYRLRSESSVAEEVRRGKKGSSKYYAVPEQEVETFPFDPNTADSTALLRLGFAPWQVRSIYKYRARGGRYHEPADVRRIPGMTNELWDRLSPCIRIDRKYQYVTPQPRAIPRALPSTDREPNLRRDTLRFPVKMQKGETVSLNTADTTALKRIPGVGSYYARRIVYYRSQLGGFASLDQLQEIEGLPEGVEEWVRIDTTGLRKIDVNHATKSQLVRHPYLGGYRAGDIWQWRHNYGSLRSIDNLRRLPNFTESDIERLKPYLEFR